MKVGPIGIHLGDERLKIAQVAQDKDKISVVEMISLNTPEGAVVGGFVKAPRVLGDAVGRAINESKFIGRKAIIAHPTEILKVHILSVPDTPDLDKTISSRLSQMAFENPEELIFDYKVVEKADDRVKAIVAITNKRHVARMHEMASEAKLTLGGTDLEMLSVFRIVSGTYKITKQPIIIAQMSDPPLKLALFSDRILTLCKTSEMSVAQCKQNPELLAREIMEFLEEYRKYNLLLEEPIVFLSGLPEPDFGLEKAVWEPTGIKTTSVRWSDAFTVSNSYTNFGELVARFGAFCCAMGLSLADTPLPSCFKSPIIADVRQPGFSPDLLKFEV